MTGHGIRRGLCALAMLALPAPACAAATTDAPPAGPAATYRLLAAQEGRIAAVAQRLLAANQAMCPPDRRGMTPGWILSDTRLVPAAARPAARAAYGIAEDAPDGVHVAALLPGGAAEVAGIRIGDVLADGDPIDVQEDRLLMAEAAAGATAVAGTAVRFHRPDAPTGLPGGPGCAIAFRLEAKDALAAAATTHRIHVSSGLVALAADDAALAFVLAHEWAHIILGHPLPGSRGWASGVRAREAAADALAVALVDAAGWDARAVPRLFVTAGRAMGLRISWSHASPRARARAAEARIAALCQASRALSRTRPSCTEKAAP